MKRFVFPLKAVLSLREAACMQAEYAYVEAIKRTAGAARELEACRVFLEKANQEHAAILSAQLLDASGAGHSVAFLQAQHKKYAVAAYSYKGFLEAQQAAMISFLEKKQALKALTELKQQQAQAHYHQQDKQEDSELQDLFLSSKNQFGA